MGGNAKKSTCLSGISPKVVLFGVILRVLAYTFGSDLLQHRVELNSPLVSFSQIKDGLLMYDRGISPYEGDSIHVQPVLLLLFRFLLKFPIILLPLQIMLDTLTGVLLSKSVSHLFSGNSEDLQNVVLKCYLLNPITVMSCSIMSLSVLYNLLAAIFVFTFTTDNGIVAVAVLGLWTNLSLYPVILVGSLWLRFSSNRYLLSFIFTASLGTLLVLNFAINEFSWSFIHNTYEFMLSVDDLTPNTGVFWYFFTQVFEHFRLFYISVFQINLLVYVVPMVFTLRTDPHLHLIVSMLMIGVFSPYPTLNDASVYLCLLPTLANYWRQPMRFSLLIGATIATCVVFMPVMWHLWIVNGSGNANFFFAVALIFNVAQIYILIDLLFAYFRHHAQRICGDVVQDKTLLVIHSSLSTQKI